MLPQAGQGPAHGGLVVDLSVPGFPPYLLLSQRGSGWSLIGGPPKYVIPWILFSGTLWQLLALSMTSQRREEIDRERKIKNR